MEGSHCLNNSCCISRSCTYDKRKCCYSETIDIEILPDSQAFSTSKLDFLSQAFSTSKLDFLLMPSVFLCVHKCALLAPEWSVCYFLHSSGRGEQERSAYANRRHETASYSKDFVYI
jgi:hypothetical protein